VFIERDVEVDANERALPAQFGVGEIANGSFGNHLESPSSLTALGMTTGI
jgi:hypothetical protein